MIIGNPSIFAIESTITRAYERQSLRALGFFVIHVRGHCYGVRSPDSTFLACSYDEVLRRLASVAVTPHRLRANQMRAKLPMRSATPFMVRNSLKAILGFHCQSLAI